MIKWREFSGMVKDYSKINILRDYFISRSQPNLLFIWIPKSAGTSIYNAIGARKFKTVEKIKHRFCGRGIVTFGHMDYSKLVTEGYIPKKFDENAFKFAIVRDPYDRAVSLYVYLKNRKKLDPDNLSFLDFLRKLNDHGIDPIGLYNFQGLSHCNPQVRWLENIKIDFIGRFESLEHDMNSIQSKLCTSELHIPHKNTSSRNKTSEYYCQESIELVDYIYREDFDTLSYSKKSNQE